MHTVLMIDDDRVLLTGWKIRLCASGFAVCTAADGMTGLELARGHHPDVILLDVRMQGMDGFEVCRALKADPNLAAIPVVFMSANVIEEARRQAIDAGAADFLPKPLAARHVLAVLEFVLTGSTGSIVKEGTQYG